MYTCIFQVTQQHSQQLVKDKNQQSLDYNLITGDTPTIYAGNPSVDSNNDESSTSSTLFGSLPSIPNILETIGSISNLQLPNIGLNMNWPNLAMGRNGANSALSSKMGTPGDNKDDVNSFDGERPPFWVEGPNGPILHPVHAEKDGYPVPNLENPEKIYPSSFLSQMVPALAAVAMNENSKGSTIRFPQSSDDTRTVEPDGFTFPEETSEFDARGQPSFTFPGLSSAFPYPKQKPVVPSLPSSETVPPLPSTSSLNLDQLPVVQSAPTRKGLPAVVHYGPGINSGTPFLPGLHRNQQSNSIPSPFIGLGHGVGTVSKVILNNRNKGHVNKEPSQVSDMNWSNPEVINPNSGVSLYQPSEPFKPYRPPGAIKNPITIIEPPRHHLSPYDPVSSLTENRDEAPTINASDYDDSRILDGENVKSYMNPSEIKIQEDTPSHSGSSVYSDYDDDPLVYPETTVGEQIAPDFDIHKEEHDKNASLDISNHPDTQINNFDNYDYHTDYSAVPSLQIGKDYSENIDSNPKDSIDYATNTNESIWLTSYDYQELQNQEEEMQTVTEEENKSSGNDSVNTSRDRTTEPSELSDYDYNYREEPVDFIRDLDSPTTERSSSTIWDLTDYEITSAKSDDNKVESVTSISTEHASLPPFTVTTGSEVASTFVPTTRPLAEITQRPPTVYGTIQKHLTRIHLSESVGNNSDYGPPNVGDGVSVIEGKLSPDKIMKIELGGKQNDQVTIKQKNVSTLIPGTVSIADTGYSDRYIDYNTESSTVVSVKNDGYFFDQEPESNRKYPSDVFLGQGVPTISRVRPASVTVVDLNEKNGNFAGHYKHHTPGIEEHNNQVSSYQQHNSEYIDIDSNSGTYDDQQVTGEPVPSQRVDALPEGPSNLLDDPIPSHSKAGMDWYYNNYDKVYVNETDIPIGRNKPINFAHTNSAHRQKLPSVITLCVIFPFIPLLYYFY